ncbi:MAG: metallophosphoesterase [Candidatus Accumulibacter sp.]|uniref:metallophosphoesterase n=1 Tax=Accumulibacter sp. TaxID=2053492 RepID=UPI0025CC7F91|nr:metallophosphoesterase [Accumulibacter sp.]MCP5249428.1 metallophosphoesterase [Accumulibacter sp.]
MPDLPTQAVDSLHAIKGIKFPANVRFRQILVTGPPGAGKSTLIRRLGGWSEEGYLDISRKYWWRSEMLSVRPREIHLGLPFTGLSNALSVYDPEFLVQDPWPQVDLARIALPPRQLFFLSVDWYRRYVFEFLLPPPELVFERRSARARHNTHPVDAQLSLEICAAQTAAFRQVAEYLHEKGFYVYVRDGIESAPQRFVDSAGIEVGTARRRRRFTLANVLARLKAISARLGFGVGRHLKLRDAYRLGDTKVRVTLDGRPIEITLGLDEKRLRLYPETRLDERGNPVKVGSFIIVDPETHLRQLGGFLRLTSKSWLVLGSDDPVQQAIFNYPSAVDGHHLAVIYGRDGLVFRNLSDAGTTIAPIVEEARVVRLNRLRRLRDRRRSRNADVAVANLLASSKAIRMGRLRRLRDIFGGPIELLPRDEALQLIQKVNRLMPNEAYRARDDRDLPGGLLTLPRSLTPIILADLHAQVDNLLTVLSQNAFLEALEDGNAALVILGDAVHCEVDGQLRAMESSMLMMDLIFRLKLRFPEQVFYVRGNHDSFSEELAKEGVPQGLLWARELSELRGAVYQKAMGEFYRLLPYVVISPDFLACHAAAPKSKVTRKMLVNIHQYPTLILELINNRLQRASRPQGYSRRDVRHFRKRLNLDPETPFIVGHTPIDREDTLWPNVDGIDHHHVLFSANPRHVGVITRVGETMVPLTYAVDKLTPIINALEAEQPVVARAASTAGEAPDDVPATIAAAPLSRLQRGA